jgi:hypothetical protein
MKRSIIAPSGVALLALLAPACSTGTSSEVSEPASSPSSTSSASRAAPKPAVHLGDTVDLTRVDGGKIAVTLMQIINPATVADGTGDTGKTYMAAKLKIADTGPTPVEGAVNVNASVLGSDNQSYKPDFNDVAECTNFESGTFHLGPGESSTGCVVFALPRGVTPAKVIYVPSAGFADDFGEWLL